MSARLGVDVGGTFTDVVLELDGTLTSVKVLTTRHAPEQGILEGIDAVLAETGVAMAALGTIIHGTTLATNALIERRGAKTAFVTTAGFRDVIETRTESRFDQYDLALVLPPPLIERRHRHTVTERLSATGEVLVPLDEAKAGRVIDTLEAEGYEAVAVGFLHSYVDGRHERRFGELLAERLPDVVVSLSADVSPQMREFERFNTVCANAFVQPVMATYLRRLEADLARLGATCPVFLMHSGGGLMSLEDAARFPVRLVESGPAGGAIFAADIAERYGLDRVLSYDMGGTTAKICLVEGHTPQTAKTFEVARTHRFTKGSGMPISIPVIEMIEIGAGGGSIASVDVLGQIRVGPESAGSEPGPASYQLGGSRPTVTDANLVLGRLSADTFGADSIDLSLDSAATAIVDGVGIPLSVDATDGAIGIVEVVDENMANAARVHAVENGKDLLGFTVIAFGGGAPLHAGRLCDKLGVDQLLVPPGAGVGSAIGFLRAPFAYEAVRSHYERIDRFDHEAVNQLLAELTAEADGFVRGGTTDERLIERWVHMRYAGQGWEIPVPLGDGAFDTMSAQQLAVRFEKSYEEYFGRAIEGLVIEAVSWGVRVATPRPSVEPVTIVDASYEVISDRTRLVHDSATGAAIEAVVVERRALEPGHRVRGPAVIVETQTTTWIGSRHEAIVQADGCLLVRLAERVR
jgi:N-methylhydantoinase A